MSAELTFKMFCIKLQTRHTTWNFIVFSISRVPMLSKPTEVLDINAFNALSIRKQCPCKHSSWLPQMLAKVTVCCEIKLARSTLEQCIAPMALAFLMLYISAKELYNFNHVEKVHDREPISIMENEVCTVRFYTSSMPSNRIFIHQNLASVVQRLSTIGEIRAGGYIVRPFHSVWSEDDHKCLGLYRYSFKDKNTYGQMHGNMRVTFRGSIGEPIVSRNKLAIDVSGELFLKVIDSLINFDYTISSHRVTGPAGLEEGSAYNTETQSEKFDTQEMIGHTENDTS